MAKFFIQAEIHVYNGRNSWSSHTWQKDIEAETVETALIAAKVDIMAAPNVENIFSITARVSQALKKFDCSASFAADNEEEIGEDYDSSDVWYATDIDTAMEEYRAYIEETRKAFKFWSVEAIAVE